eukprot:5449912-Heterocapsa_arctica.AAC.1
MAGSSARVVSKTTVAIGINTTPSKKGSAGGGVGLAEDERVAKQDAVVFDADVTSGERGLRDEGPGQRIVVVPQS